MTVVATVGMDLTLQVTRTDVESMGSADSLHTAFNTRRVLNSSSTPPVTKSYTAQLTATANLDFTALVDDQLSTQDMSGLKLQSIMVNNLSTANTLTISDGAANPYTINNNLDIQIPIGGSIHMFFNDQLADVAAGAKMLDIVPTAGQAYQVVMVFG